jgi:hypothetical protein
MRVKVGASPPPSLDRQAAHDASVDEIRDGWAENIAPWTEGKQVVLYASWGYHTETIIMKRWILGETGE